MLADVQQLARELTSAAQGGWGSTSDRSGVKNIAVVYIQYREELNVVSERNGNRERLTKECRGVSAQLAANSALCFTTYFVAAGHGWCFELRHVILLTTHWLVGEVYPDGMESVDTGSYLIMPIPDHSYSGNGAVGIPRFQNS